MEYPDYMQNFFGRPTYENYERSMLLNWIASKKGILQNEIYHSRMLDMVEVEEGKHRLIKELDILEGKILKEMEED